MYAYAGAPATAKFINKKLGSKYSTTPIIDLVDAVAEGKIIVTNREIWKVAKEDPATEALIERFRDSLSGDFFDGRLIAQMNPRKRKKQDQAEALRDITAGGSQVGKAITPKVNKVTSRGEEGSPNQPERKHGKLLEPYFPNTSMTEEQANKAKKAENLIASIEEGLSAKRNIRRS